jgi:hypothetical protein
MRKLVVVLAIAAAVALGLFIPRGSSAPALGEKPVKYEYAELRYTRGFVGQMGKGMAGMGAGGGGLAPGPVAAGGGGGPPQAAAVQSSVHWTTAQEDVVTKEWEELADKLEAPSPKKDSPVTVHKLRVLNALSAEGWELLDKASGDGNSTWSFRRQVR